MKNNRLEPARQLVLLGVPGQESVNRLQNMLTY